MRLALLLVAAFLTVPHVLRAAQVDSASGWKRDSTLSEMDGKASYRLELRAEPRDSKTSTDITAEQLPAMLTIFCSPDRRKPEVGLVLAEKVDAIVYRGEWRARLRTKLDGAEPHSEVWLVGRDFQTMFPLEGRLRKVENLASAAHLLVEVPLLNAGLQVSRFQVASLAHELTWLKAACDNKP